MEELKLGIASSTRVREVLCRVQFEYSNRDKADGRCKGTFDGPHSIRRVDVGTQYSARLQSPEIWSSGVPKDCIRIVTSTVYCAMSDFQHGVHTVHPIHPACSIRSSQSSQFRFMRERDHNNQASISRAARHNRIRYASRQTSEEQRGFPAKCRVVETADRRGSRGGERVRQSRAAALAQDDAGTRIPDAGQGQGKERCAQAGNMGRFRKGQFSFKVSPGA